MEQQKWAELLQQLWSSTVGQLQWTVWTEQQLNGKVLVGEPYM
jgi:hypothetical protein